MRNEDTNLVERIAADFSEGDGPCKYCPKRDDDCYATPVFGYGKYDAEVMVVSESPGGTKTINKTDDDLHKDRKRRWKNYRETGVEHEKEAYTKQIQPIGDLPIDAGGLPDRLAKEFTVYFTNSAKCNDIHPSETIPDKYRKLLNEYGKRRCLSHLNKELKYIDPNVVIVLSNSKSKDNLNHLETMFNFFGLADKSPSGSRVKDYVYNPEYQSNPGPFSTYYSEKYECDVIPSYHFSYGFKNGVANEKYCNDMATTVRGIIGI